MGLLRCPFQGLCPRGHSKPHVPGRGYDVPRTGHPQPISRHLQRRERSRGQPVRLFDVDLRVGQEPQAKPGKGCVRADALVRGRGGPLHRLGQGGLRPRILPGISSGDAQIDEQLGPTRIARRQQADRPLDQVDGGRQIAARQSPSTGRRQEHPGSLAESSVVLAGIAELGSIPVRLLEVIRQDLLVLGRPRAGDVLQPTCESLVHLGSGPLGHRLVRGIADQDVAEAEAIVAGEGRSVGADQLLPHEGHQMASDARPGVLWQQRGHRATMEHAALDGGHFDQRSLLRLEAVDARREQRLDRRRDRELAVSDFGLHGDQLLDEERIPLGRLDDALPHLLREVAQRLDQDLRRLPLVRPERHDRRARLRRGPRRTDLEQVGPSHAEEEQRYVGCKGAHVLDQIEQGRFGPVDVVNDDDQWPLARQRLEQPAEAPGDLLGRCGPSGGPQ